MGTRKQPQRQATDRLLGLFATMTRIRVTENRLTELFAAGQVPGFIHLSIGQEAVAAGVMTALGPSDTLATTHRGHGHVLARGVKLDDFFKEVMGKAGGICGGRGGSMHIADVSLGVLGANGIVAAGIPIAMGSALAHRVRETGAIAVGFFGDGAMAEGALYETLNLAALWKLPLLLVCENNGWSEFSPTSRQFMGTLSALAAAFGVAYFRVDGNDALAVADTAAEAAGHARSAGPAVLECITCRVRGHYEGDPQKYRGADELQGLGAQDPVTRARVRLIEAGVDESALAAIATEVEEAVSASVAAARTDVMPDFESAMADVYTQVPR